MERVEAGDGSAEEMNGRRAGAGREVQAIGSPRLRFAGAGKTETAKRFLQYLAYAATLGGTGQDESARLEARVVATSPLLEAFGNAQVRRGEEGRGEAKCQRVRRMEEARSEIGRILRWFGSATVGKANEGTGEGKSCLRPRRVC